MIFTSLDFAVFGSALFVLYHLVVKKQLQNPLLLTASYFFYGYVHPWFCALIFAVTVVNWGAPLLMERYPARKKLILIAAVALSLGQLGWFKYFNFFATSIQDLASLFGLKLGYIETQVFLPLGISFFTFQALSYTIDVYRGRFQARRNFLNVALYIAFFPQLASGPITRAERLLSAVEKERKFDFNVFYSAWPLLITGYLKKLVIADNLSVYTDKVFGLAAPNFLLLLAGTLAFTVQIYADFSAYTDIARGVARLFGFELSSNFNQPYAAVSPSDFWRRWHISFSTWIRDYLYIPLGGSRLEGSMKPALALFATFSLSGLWHGPAWHYVLWGAYHGALLLIYRKLKMAGRWQPSRQRDRLTAQSIMFVLAAFGWLLFRTPSMKWLFHAFTSGTFFSASSGTVAVFLVIVLWTLLYSLPLFFIPRIERADFKVRAFALGLFAAACFVFVRDGRQDFIYFQF